MKKCFVGAAVIIAAMVLMVVTVFSQDNKGPSAEGGGQAPQAVQVAAPQTPAPEEVAKTNEVSIYGEVQAVNVQANSITVQYYDYDNDEEKTMEVVLDKDSKLENVKAIGEIKKGDWADITCVLAGAKFTAKLVNVEKEELGADEEAPAATEE